MQLYYEVVAFAVGLVVGSFLNVVIARVPEGQSIVAPRSRCPKCGGAIAWYDNVPVLSWLWLGARCRRCRQPISARYPTVELLTGLLALALARAHPFGPWAVALFLFVSLLVAVTYIDLDHWLIPHALTWPGIVLGLVARVFAPDSATAVQRVLAGALGAVGGFAAFALVGWLGAKAFKKEALGQGDWWLLAMIGAFLGWKALLPVVLLASLQGALVGIALILLGRSETGKRPASAPAAEGGTPVPEIGSGPAETLAPAPAPVGETAPAGGTPATEEAEDEEDDWVPPKNAVPFGPFLALAAMEQLFVGGWLFHLYDRLLVRLFS